MMTSRSKYRIVEKQQIHRSLFIIEKLTFGIWWRKLGNVTQYNNGCYHLKSDAESAIRALEFGTKTKIHEYKEDTNANI